MLFSQTDPNIPNHDFRHMNIRYVFDITIGLFGTLFAALMFFYFPGLQAWTFTALHPIAALKPAVLGPGIWINLLLVFAVVLPGVFGPLFLATRARRFAVLKMSGACFALAALFLFAAMRTPLLYGRVALLALLSGQLLALGIKAEKSVPWNWMAYLGFVLAYFTFPDAGILSAANILTGAYLLASGVYLLLADKPKRPKQSRFRVTIG
jgi:hypothetical protein